MCLFGWGGEGGSFEARRPAGCREGGGMEWVEAVIAQAQARLRTWGGARGLHWAKECTMCNVQRTLFAVYSVTHCSVHVQRTAQRSTVFLVLRIGRCAVRVTANPPSAVRRPPSAVRRPPSAVRRPPSRWPAHALPAGARCVCTRRDGPAGTCSRSTKQARRMGAMGEWMGGEGAAGRLPPGEWRGGSRCGRAVPDPARGA